MVVLTEKGRKKVRSYVSDCADFYTASGLTAAESLPVPTEELILSEIPAEEVTDPASGRFYGTHWGIRIDGEMNFVNLMLYRGEDYTEE